MRNTQAITTDDRLDTGMSAREAVARASAWWDKTGRHIAVKAGERDRVMASVSGICAGHVWDHLTKREKHKVVRSWHHFHVRRPDMLDIATGAPFKLGGKEKVQ